MVFGVLAATINVIHSIFMAYTVIKQGEVEISPPTWQRFINFSMSTGAQCTY